MYRVWQVKNEFNSGKFIQILSLLRVRNQEVKVKRGTKANIKKADKPNPHGGWSTNIKTSTGDVYAVGDKMLEEKKDYYQKPFKGKSRMSR